MKIIAMGADNAYLNKIETTIKSIALHNDHFKIYIFNDDLPSEWFRVMNKRLEVISSMLVNVKISDNHLRKYDLPMAHLSYAAYFRFFIPDMIAEEKVLYLDSDIIVRGSLDEVFAVDLEESPLAVVRDELQWTNFNSGVMLINNAYWKKYGISAKLFEVADRYHSEEFGDQGILNRFFVGQWKEMSANYNFMVGMDTIAPRTQKMEWFEKANSYEKTALVIHYTGEKPWASTFLNRLGEEWWFYHSLDWSDILLRKAVPIGKHSTFLEEYPYHTAIFTNACEMEHLEYLIKNLPSVHFHILAHTTFASQVMDLQTYLNVSVYPNFNPYNLENVLNKIDFYLDINHFNEIVDINEKIHQLGKAIFTFDTVAHRPELATEVFNPSEPEKMVEAIKNYLAKKGETDE